MRRSFRMLALAVGLALSAAAVHADDDPQAARLREALRQSAARLQETQAQLEQAQLAVAEAQRERDALKLAAPAAKKDDARAAALQRQLGASASELAQAKADGQKFQTAQQAAEQAARKSESERLALAGELAKLRARMEHCAANDDAMYRTGMEIAALYRDPDFVHRLHDLHVWPLGFSRVRQENRMRSLEDRFADEHVQAESCRSAVAAPATAAMPTAVPGAASVADQPQASQASTPGGSGGVP